MRRHCCMLLCLPLLLAPEAVAQTNPPGQQPPQPAVAPAPVSPRVGLVDFGVRVNGSSGDPALLQEFRDLRDGPTINTLRYVRRSDAWEFNTAFDNVGYRD